MIRCPFCGFENDEGATRCGACGARLATRARPSSPPPDRTIPSPETAVEKSEDKSASGELVGRSAQIEAILAEARKVAQKGRSAAVFLEGGEGMGKTALATHATRRIRDRLGSFTTIQSTCLPGSRDPFAPVEALVAELLRIPPFARETGGVALEEQVEKQLVSLRLFEDDEERTEHARVIGNLLARSADAVPAEPGAGGAAPMDRKLRTLEKLFGRLTETRQLALVFDEIHNGTQEGLYLLTNLYEALLGRPILWIFSADENALPALEAVQGTRIELPALSEWEVALVLQDIFPDLKPFPEELWQILARTSRGNPGTLHTLIGLLIDERVLDLGNDGLWHFNTDQLQADDLPLDREAVLKVRYEGLESSHQQALTFASMVGPVFWDDVVMALMRDARGVPGHDSAAHVWPDDRENLTVGNLLDDVARKGFISQVKTSAFPGMCEYIFMHEGFCQDLHDDVPPDEAAAHHRFVARWLEMAAGDQIPEFAELIATQWRQGSRRGEASAFYMQAGDMARRRYLFDRARELYLEALEHMPDDDVIQQMRVLHDLGSVHEMRGEISEALDCYDRMLESAWRFVNRSKAAASLSKIGRLYRTQGDYSAARAYLERALKLFSQGGDRRGIASTQDDLGNILYLQGNYQRAATLYLEAINLREELGDTRGLALSYEHLGQVDRAMGNLTEAENRFRQVLEMRRSIHDEEGMCSALNALGVVAYDRGSTEAAVAIWREALEIAIHCGNLRLQEYLYNNLGEALVGAKRLPQAEGYFKHALELSMSLADRRAETEVCRNLGILYVEMGNRPLGREYLNRSLAIARDIGSREAMGIALRSLGQLEGHSVFDEEAGPEGAAESYFQEALDLFQKMGNETELLKTHESYARYLFDHGRVAEAVSKMEQAVGLGERMGDETRARLASELARMRRFA